MPDRDLGALRFRVVVGLIALFLLALLLTTFGPPVEPVRLHPLIPRQEDSSGEPPE